MARVRTIKPQFMRSHSMRSASKMARLTFIQLWLAELEREHCIEGYTVEGDDYLRIVNWRRHQGIYHPSPSRLPARPVARASGETCEAHGSECEKPNDDKGLTLIVEIPERVASVANRS